MAFLQATKKNSGKLPKLWKYNEVIPYPGANGGRPWQSVVAWRQALAAAAWRRLDVRDGAQGPLVGEARTRRVVSRPHRRPPGAEALVPVLRSRARAQAAVVPVADARSQTVPEPALEECARVAQAAHRIEACRQRSTSAAGWAAEEGRQQLPENLSWKG